jgi:hypothetical protein
LSRDPWCVPPVELISELVADGRVVAPRDALLLAVSGAAAGRMDRLDVVAPEPGHDARRANGAGFMETVAPGGTRVVGAATPSLSGLDGARNVSGLAIGGPGNFVYEPHGARRDGHRSVAR